MRLWQTSQLLVDVACAVSLPVLIDGLRNVTSRELLVPPFELQFSIDGDWIDVLTSLILVVDGL